MKYKTSKREMYYHLPKRFMDVDGREYNGATVFFREEDNGWRSSVAMCSKNDQFNRKLGRNVARRRYMQEKQEFDDLVRIAVSLGDAPYVREAEFLEQPNYGTALDVAGVSGFWCDEAEDYCAPSA